MSLKKAFKNCIDNHLMVNENLIYRKKTTDIVNVAENIASKF